MWLRRSEHQRLLSELADAVHACRLAEERATVERRYHTTQLRELLRRVRVAEQRETEASELMATERTENRTAERWWSDALLRAKQSLPLSAKQAPEVASSTSEPPLPAHWDDGELDALIAEGARYGASPETVTEMYRREHGVSN